MMSRLPGWLLLLSLLLACTPGEKSGLEGRLLFRGKPLGEARVEVYLKAEKDRATAPFAVTATDPEGRFEIELPPGSYYLIGKKKDQAPGGRTRMLMAECPANPVGVDAGFRRVAPFSLREMGRDGGLVPDPGTGVAGRVTHRGQPVEGAFVYVYTEDASGLKGPSYAEAVRTGKAGDFQIGLPAGRYYLAARRRADRSRVGEPLAGDLNGLCPDNPVTVPKGRVVNLAPITLDPVAAEDKRQRLQEGKFQSTGTALTGRVLDKDGRPVPGVYVFGYLDSRMVGKPTYISAATGRDGRFELHLGEGGTYYIGARSAFGGPLEPGEWVGTYEGRPDHGFEIGQDQTASIGPITVREVW